MNNVDKIRISWDMSYSAMIVFGEFRGNVILIDEHTGTFCIRTDKNAIKQITFVLAEQIQDCLFEITGYKYAGELAGNEPIPEGQKFRVKETGEIGTLICIKEEILLLNFDKGEADAFKNLVEPVFN